MSSPLDTSLASAIHEHYRAQAKREGWSMRHDVPWAELPAEIQRANLAAAARIPYVLGVAGLHLVAAGDDAEARESPPCLSDEAASAILEDSIEAAAIAEHEGWMEEKTAAGWRRGPARDDAAKVHPSIISYEELSEEEKEKDRSAVRNYPALARRAGMRLARAGQ